MLVKKIYPSSNNLCSRFQINENSKIVIFWEYINLGPVYMEWGTLGLVG